MNFNFGGFSGWPFSPHGWVGWQVTLLCPLDRPFENCVRENALLYPNFILPLGKGGQLELPHADMIEEMDRMKRLMKIKEANGEKEEPKIVEMHDFNP